MHFDTGDLRIEEPACDLRKKFTSVCRYLEVEPEMFMNRI